MQKCKGKGKGSNEHKREKSGNHGGKGGGDTLDNLHARCASCNASMGDRYTLAEWDALGPAKVAVREPADAPVVAASIPRATVPIHALGHTKAAAREHTATTAAAASIPQLPRVVRASAVPIVLYYPSSRPTCEMGTSKFLSVSSDLWKAVTAAQEAVRAVDPAFHNGAARIRIQADDENISDVVFQERARELSTCFADLSSMFWLGKAQRSLVAPCGGVRGFGPVTVNVGYFDVPPEAVTRSALAAVAVGAAKAFLALK